jgi:hypothetical protein
LVVCRRQVIRSGAAVLRFTDLFYQEYAVTEAVRKALGLTMDQ